MLRDFFNDLWLPANLDLLCRTGAHAVQMVSALLAHGPQHLRAIREQMVTWMAEHEYESVRQMQGSMSLQRSPDPGAFERANYMCVLQSWRS